jgi:hypothetical protein
LGFKSWNLSIQSHRLKTFHHENEPQNENEPQKENHLSQRKFLQKSFTLVGLAEDEVGSDIYFETRVLSSNQSLIGPEVAWVSVQSLKLKKPD